MRMAERSVSYSVEDSVRREVFAIRRDDFRKRASSRSGRNALGWSISAADKFVAKCRGTAKSAHRCETRCIRNWCCAAHSPGERIWFPLSIVPSRLLLNRPSCAIANALHEKNALAVCVYDGERLARCTNSSRLLFTKRRTRDSSAGNEEIEERAD